MEQIEAEKHKDRDNAAKQNGRTFGRRGVLAYSASAEQSIMALPGYVVYRKPLQNPDGSPLFMLGVTPLTADPNA